MPEPEDDAEQLAPDEAARAVFGVMQAPDAAPGTVSSPDFILAREQERRLQSALQELAECRRLIDDALNDEAA
jgi:hypothetical protein